MRTFDVHSVRKDFPILSSQVQGKPLIYFDNGATSQKPKRVIDRLKQYYEEENANVHRGVHYLSDRATQAYEDARKNVANFIGASSHEEIIFTKGTTDGINTIAFSLGELLNKGDEILISGMEHHANIVPWQLLCERKGLQLKIIPILENGTLDMSTYAQLLNKKTKLVSVVHVSNTLGTINPIESIINQAKSVGAKVLVDAAQSIQHLPINVAKLDCDFLVFSGHKVFGPTGIGVLYGRKALLNELPPYQGGGDMIELVTFERSTFQQAPLKFEAGTPNIAGAIGLSAAFDYLNSIDLKLAFAHEFKLSQYLRSRMNDISSIKFIGDAPETCATRSFLIGNLHPLDLGTLLDKQGIAVRTGHHCTQPLMQRFNIPGTVRASLSFYNTMEEIDQFIVALERSINLLS